MHIRLIEKGKNINFANYKNTQQLDYAIKTSKSINTAKIEFKNENINSKINFSNSTNDFNKLNFPHNKLYEFNKDNTNTINEENVIKNDNYIKEISERKSVSGTNEFYSNIRNSRDIYSTRTFNEKLNYEANDKNKIYNSNENVDENYRNNTNPNIYENKNNYGNERDLNFRRDYNDDFKIDKKSRPLSVNNYSSKYLNRDEDDFSKPKDVKGFVNEQQQELRNKYNRNTNQVDYNKTSSKRLDLEQKYSTSNKNNIYEEKNHSDNFHTKKFSENENILSNNNRNFTQSINNSANKSLSANNIPETNFNYGSCSFNKYNNNNFDLNKNNFNSAINPEFIKNSYNFTSTEGNTRADPYSHELNINNRLDEIIDISKNNYKDINSKNTNENEYINPQSNQSKVRYLSEKRIFREKKDDQKNLISKI